MKNLIYTVIILATSTAVADEFIVMDNGMTCFRNKSGFTYGCNGGVDNGSGGFNDVKTGTRYNYINPNQALDTRSGMPMNTPYRNNNRPKYNSNPSSNPGSSYSNNPTYDTRSVRRNNAATLHQRMNSNVPQLRKRKANTKIYQCNGVFTDQPCSE